MGREGRLIPDGAVAEVLGEETQGTAEGFHPQDAGQPVYARALPSFLSLFFGIIQLLGAS